MRGKFFNVIFYLVILIFMIACKPDDLLNTTDYIGTVKKIEINSPDYNSKNMITIQTLVYGFIKASYDEVTIEDIKWEKLGNLDNGQLIKASFKDASVEIRAIKNGDFVEIKPIELDFRDKNGNKYNILDVPFKNVSTSTDYNNSASSNTYSTNSSNEDYTSNYNNSSNETYDPSTVSQTSIENEIYNKYRNKFGKVINDKYVGGSLIEFLNNTDDIEEYEYLKDQFFELLETMYVTQDKKTYYYLTDIIINLANKADTNLPAKEELAVENKKLYYILSFPKDYTANTPSWVKFEIFEREFKDGLALRTAHVSCAINGVEYKDWEAVAAIYK
ncbi:MAG: hypothetical protein ACTTJX_07645 [Fusobacterium sp.]|uniref:hypothetical protein n=1 Tax=Fusobacterium sp. TaxID=68766 RepID=UPI003F9ED1AA